MDLDGVLVANRKAVSASFDGLDAVSKHSLPEQVFRTLRDGLMSGRFAPGQRVPLRSIAAALGTSTMPAREAVNRLVTLGALILLPNRRVSVPALSAQRYRDLATTRMIVESSAAEAATTLLADADIELLCDIHRRIRKCLADLPKPAAHQQYLNLNRQFHFTIYAANGSELLMTVIETLWLQVGPYLNLTLEDSREWFKTDQHLPILKALQSRAPLRVKQAVREKIDHSAKFMLTHKKLENLADIQNHNVSG